MKELQAQIQGVGQVLLLFSQDHDEFLHWVRLRAPKETDLVSPLLVRRVMAQVPEQIQVPDGSEILGPFLLSENSAALCWLGEATAVVAVFPLEHP